jgi:ABC-type transport system involved in multi-copper enzyme maturation permease subunit
MFDTRLIRAEILKLRRRPGLLAAVAVCTFFAVAGYYAVIVALHAASPDAHAAAGGIGSFKDAMGVLSLIGSVVGVLVGATAGGADIEAGVYRDLVATGRSRTALFFARVPGAWAIVVPPILAAVAIAALLSSLLNGPTAAPTASELVSGAAGALVAGMLLSAACVGLASLANSRGMVIGVALAFQLGISPLLAQLTLIGDARYGIPQVAVARISGEITDEVALTVAIGVVLAWAAACLAAGLWRARTQEI